MGMAEIAEKEREINALKEARVQKLYDIKHKETTIDNTMAAMRQIIVNTCDQLKIAAGVHKGEPYLDLFCKGLEKWIEAIRISGDAIMIGGIQEYDDIKELVEQATGHIWQGITNAENLKAAEISKLVGELQQLNHKIDEPAPNPEDVVDNIHPSSAPVK